jgi:hypothetical protein
LFTYSNASTILRYGSVVDVGYSNAAWGCRVGTCDTLFADHLNPNRTTTVLILLLAVLKAPCPKPPTGRGASCDGF